MKSTPWVLSESTAAIAVASRELGNDVAGEEDLLTALDVHGDGNGSWPRRYAPINRGEVGEA